MTQSQKNIYHLLSVVLLNSKSPVVSMQTWVTVYTRNEKGSLPGRGGAVEEGIAGLKWSEGEMKKWGASHGESSRK